MSGYEKAWVSFEEYKCAECDRIVRVENLKTYDGRKVCEDCYHELSALDWMNDILHGSHRR